MALLNRNSVSLNTTSPESNPEPINHVYYRRMHQRRSSPDALPDRVHGQAFAYPNYPYTSEMLMNFSIQISVSR